MSKWNRKLPVTLQRFIYYKFKSNGFRQSTLYLYSYIYFMWHNRKKNLKRKPRYDFAAQCIPKFQSSVSRSGKSIACICKNMTAFRTIYKYTVKCKHRMSCRPTYLEGKFVISLTSDLYFVGQVSQVTIVSVSLSTNWDCHSCRNESIFWQLQNFKLLHQMQEPGISSSASLSPTPLTSKFPVFTYKIPVCSWWWLS